MAIHSSILAWRIPWTEEPGGLQSLGSQESDTTERLTVLLLVDQFPCLFFCVTSSLPLNGYECPEAIMI